MHRTNTCGELNLNDLGKEVILAGWVQKSRDLGGMTFIDVRDRYGITQLVFNMDEDKSLCAQAREISREYVIKVTGTVVERSNKNPKMPTGDIELKVSALEILNAAKLPPFLIEDETDACRSGCRACRIHKDAWHLRRTYAGSRLSRCL